MWRQVQCDDGRACHVASTLAVVIACVLCVSPTLGATSQQQNHPAKPVGTFSSPTRVDHATHEILSSVAGHAAAANVTLTSSEITLSFGMARGDLVLTSLAPAAHTTNNLVSNASTAAPMWAFGVVDELGSDLVTSRDPCANRTLESRVDAEGSEVAVLTWHGVSMRGANTTVVVTVRLPRNSDTSLWTLSAVNHDTSRNVGLWNSTLYFNGMQATINDTVFRPSGFGELNDATLFRCSCASYPSNAATMQFSALGGSSRHGVYTAALDSEALPKTLAFGTRGPQWPASAPDVCPSQCRALIVGSDDAAATIFSSCVFGPSGGGTHSVNTSADFAYVLPTPNAGSRWSTFSTNFEYALGVIPLDEPREDRGDEDSASQPSKRVGNAADPVEERRRRALWWEAAWRYRSWVMAAAPWVRGAHMSERDDMPQWWRDTHLMANSHWQCAAPFNHTAATAEIVLSRATRLRQLVGNFTLHWYEWQEHFWMPGTSPDYLPPRDGFAAAVAVLAEQGVRVLPYIDAHLIDQNGSSWASIQSAACSWAAPRFGAPNRVLYEERWGTEHRTLSQVLVNGPSWSAVANPSCSMWQQAVGELVGKLVSEYGTSGAYLDQLAAAKAYTCYSSGGDATATEEDSCVGGWVVGVNKMLQSGRLAAGNDAVQITEGNAEPYMRDVQGYLVLGAMEPPVAPEVRRVGVSNETRFTRQLAPAFNAIYGGHYVCIGALFCANDFVDPDVFAARLAASFSFGCQLGWFALGGTAGGQCNDGVSNSTDPCGDMGVFEHLASPSHTAEVAFLNSLLEWRRHPIVQEHLLFGRLARPLPPQDFATFLAPMFDSNHTPLRYPENSVGPFPSLMVTTWLSSNNDSLLVLCVNTRKAASPLQTDVTIDATLEGLATNGTGLTVVALQSDPRLPHVRVAVSKTSTVRVAHDVDTRSVVALLVTPSIT